MYDCYLHVSIPLDELIDVIKRFVKTNPEVTLVRDGKYNQLRIIGCNEMQGEAFHAACHAYYRAHAMHRPELQNK